VALGAILMSYAAQQCRKPGKRRGRAVLRFMNEGHARVTTWGLSHLAIEPTFTVLDVGCGGGRTISALASMASRGNVLGIDYSTESVTVARETNRQLIEQGRVDIQLGSVSQLPYADGTFDVVTAVETHYYWPDLTHDIREVRRVLKHGGRFVIIAETYRGRRNDWVFRPTMTLLLRAAYLTPDQHKELLEGAGFADVQVFVERANGWICAIGTRGDVPADAGDTSP
jgi:ubiquinone/menaquinone biosynthesis C-methylase UbiE